MYKVSSARSQQRLDRGTTAAALASGNTTPSVREQNENLRREIARLEAEIVKLPRGSRERKRLGTRKHELQVQRTAVRAKNGGPRIDWNAIHNLYRNLVATHMSVAVSDALMMQAKLEYCAANNIDPSAICSQELLPC